MPYFIITYDISEERVNKVRKTLKKYFMWVQNSVFEGEIGIGKLQQCINELLEIINHEEDSVYFYQIDNRHNCAKMVLGIEKEMTDHFL
jgi:CRISPR-associated protein Cas2